MSCRLRSRPDSINSCTSASITWSWTLPRLSIDRHSKRWHQAISRFSSNSCGSSSGIRGIKERCCLIIQSTGTEARRSSRSKSERLVDRSSSCKPSGSDTSVPSWVSKLDRCRPIYRFCRAQRSCRLRNRGKSRIYATNWRELEIISIEPRAVATDAHAHSQRAGITKTEIISWLPCSDSGQHPEQPQIDWPENTARPGEIIDERTQARESLPEAGALREESCAFENRLCTWMAIGEAQNDVEECLMEDSQLSRYAKGIRERWPDLFRAREKRSGDRCCSPWPIETSIA